MLTHEQIEELLGEPCPLDHRMAVAARAWEPGFKETNMLAFLKAMGRWNDTGFEMNFQKPDFKPEPGERKRFRLLRGWPECKHLKDVGKLIFDGQFGNAIPSTVARVYGFAFDELVDAIPIKQNPLPSSEKQNPPEPADDPVYAKLAEILGTSHEDAFARCLDSNVIGHFEQVLAHILLQDAESTGKSYEISCEDLRAALRHELAKSASAYHAQANALADLVTDKQAQYGDSFGRSGAILQVLYPDGIPVKAYTSALTLIRVIDKLFRLATHSEDIAGENPWRDIAGYALLMIARGL